jgi:hypothetical protein
MDQGSTAPPIDEVVGLLAVLAPSSLERLRREHPDKEAQQLLQVGTILGPTSNLELRGKAALEALHPVTGRCDQAIAQLKRRVSKAVKLRIGAQLAAAIFGFEVLTALAVHWPNEAAFIGAAAGVASSVTAILVEHFMKMELTGRDAGDLLRELVEARVEADFLKSELIIAREDAWRSRGLPDLVGRANALAATLRKLLFLIA